MNNSTHDNLYNMQQFLKKRRLQLTQYEIEHSKSSIT